MGGGDANSANIEHGTGHFDTHVRRGMHNQSPASHGRGVRHAAAADRASRGDTSATRPRVRLGTRTLGLAKERLSVGCRSLGHSGSWIPRMGARSMGPGPIWVVLCRGTLAVAVAQDRATNTNKRSARTQQGCILALRADLVWLGTESNRRHADFQSAALPTELPSRCIKPIKIRELRHECQSATTRGNTSRTQYADPDTAVTSRHRMHRAHTRGRRTSFH